MNKGLSPPLFLGSFAENLIYSREIREEGMFMRVRMKSHPLRLKNSSFFHLAIIGRLLSRIIQHRVGLVDLLDLTSASGVLGMQIRMPFSD